MPIPFKDPHTCQFWYTHCQRCTDETPQLELAALEGECERCARKCVAMAEDVLANPDGPCIFPMGEDPRGPDLYFQGADYWSRR